MKFGPEALSGLIVSGRNAPARQIRARYHGAHAGLEVELPAVLGIIRLAVARAARSKLLIYTSNGENPLNAAAADHRLRCQIVFPPGARPYARPGHTRSRMSTRNRKRWCIERTAHAYRFVEVKLALE